MSSDYKFSTLLGFIGIIIGLCAFTVNYNLVHFSLPGYEIIVAPAIYLMSFFSEETDFVPKIILFLTGQFIGYFSLAFMGRKFHKRYLLTK